MLPFEGWPSIGRGYAAAEADGLAPNLAPDAIFAVPAAPW
jgi:hypothetical protein